MKGVRVSFVYHGKKFSFDAEKCEGAKQGLGLMFKPKDTKPLLFDFKKPTNMALTSLFVFFPFVAVWLDGKNNALAVEKIWPFRLVIQSPKGFVRLLEIPINGKHHKKLASIVDIKRFKKT